MSILIPPQNKTQKENLFEEFNEVINSKVIFINLRE